VVTGDIALGNAGYAITGSGGGGADGDYVFVDLAELDSLITEWTAIRDAIQTDGDKLMQAAYLIAPPAEDDMSEAQSAAMVASLEKAQGHNDAMFAYADSYLGKLTAARHRYAEDDDLNAARMRGIDEN
jgi:hypothetical protein